MKHGHLRREYARRFNAARRRRFLEAGLCGVCGRRPPSEGVTACSACRTEEARRQKRYRERARDELFRIYGGPVCVCCGERERFFLAFDHVAGDGAAHRREITSGENHGVCARQLYKNLRRRGFPPVLRVLCHNCNHGRQLNGGICPHSIARGVQGISDQPVHWGPRGPLKDRESAVHPEPRQTDLAWPSPTQDRVPAKPPARVADFQGMEEA